MKDNIQKSTKDALSFWGPISILLNLIFTVANVYLFWSVSPLLSEDIEIIGYLKSGQAIDSLEVAAQIGRLDVIALILSMIGLLFVVGTLGSFIYLRHMVISRAEAEAREEIRNNADKIIWDATLKRLPTQISPLILDNDILIDQITERVKRAMNSTNENGSDDANDFANAMDGGE
jgi:hypothetical protein